MSEVIDRGALVPVESMKAVQVFAPGGVKGILDRLKADAKAQRFDMSKPADRDACRAYAYKLARSKTALDDMGKDLTEDWRRRTGAVNAERKLLRDELDALAAEVRAPLTAYEDAEKTRIDGHEQAIAAILEAGKFAGPDPTKSEVEARMDYVLRLPERDWREFAERATNATADTMDRLGGKLALAEKREAAAAAAVLFEAEQAERRRQEAARLQAAREAEIAEQAAQRARIEAERQAAIERQKVAEREREAALATQRAEERARQAEQDRIAEAAAAERRRADEVAAAEARRAAEARAAEQRRLDEAAAAERRQAEAVAAERRRQEEERAQQEHARRAEEADAARRAASKAHRQKINGEALRGLHALGVDEALGKAIIVAIAGKSVPHISITY